MNLCPMMPEPGAQHCAISPWDYPEKHFTIVPLGSQVGAERTHPRSGTHTCSAARTVRREHNGEREPTRHRTANLQDTP